MSNSKVIEMNQAKMGGAKGGVRTIMSPKSPITFQNCEEVKAKFIEYMEQHKTEIILDLKSVSHIDSDALELLVQMDEELKNRGGMLKIVNANDLCKDIFLATRLMNTLQIYQDIHTAIKSRS